MRSGVYAVLADGANSLEVAATLDAEGTIQQVKISYSRGFFRRNAAYQTDDETLRGSISAMAGRNEILVKLGRFREINAELALFRALLKSHGCVHEAPSDGRGGWR